MIFPELCVLGTVFNWSCEPYSQLILAFQLIVDFCNSQFAAQRHYFYEGWELQVIQMYKIRVQNHENLLGKYNIVGLIHYCFSEENAENNSKIGYSI